MPPLTAEQLDMRNGPSGFIGASEIAGALGVSRWKRPIDVWLEKTGRGPEQGENPRASIGLRAEPVLFSWYLEDTGTKTLCLRGESVRHPTVECAGCTPDYLVYDEAGALARLAQLKCVGAHMAQFWPADGVPEDVECQCQFEMEVCGAPFADVVAWLGGTDFRIIPIERDREFGAMLISGAREFWKYVIDDYPPPLDGSESWRKYLTAKYPREEQEELSPAPEQAELWGIKALRAREAIKAAEAQQEEADNHLRSMIGDGAGLIGTDWYATWRANKKGVRSLNVKWRKNAND
jgi:predicted phage-related endonuclease